MLENAFEHIIDNLIKGVGGCKFEMNISEAVEFGKFVKARRPRHFNVYLDLFHREESKVYVEISSCDACGEEKACSK